MQKKYISNNKLVEDGAQISKKVYRYRNFANTATLIKPYTGITLTLVNPLENSRDYALIVMKLHIMER